MATQYKNLIDGKMIDTGEWCDKCGDWFGSDCDIQ